MTRLQALIFDVDGTLANTERDGHRLAFNTAFAEAGLDWHWSVAEYGDLLAVAGGKERIRHYMQQACPGWQAPVALEAFIAQLHGAKSRHYQSLLAQQVIPLRLGVRRLLQEAREQGMRLAIATTSTLANTMALLKHCLDPEAPTWFEVMATGDQVAAQKPAPDVYLLALQQLGLAPQSCLVFEDSAIGCQATDAARLPVIITVNNYTCHHSFPEARLVLDSLGEPAQPLTVLSQPSHHPIAVEYVDMAFLYRFYRDYCD